MSMNITISPAPTCPKCEKGVILPFFDTFIKNEFGIAYPRGWACFNCGANLLFTQGSFERRDVPEEAKLQER